ncbi:pur operon repressor [Hydrogenibacillus schlegelii]|uniref:PurR: transcription regulator associated with purine metabolism n=1 Tax=Hydrogenibacillus schlegelii TaxID=1484 RepID=A0A2T5GA47_HYDSH|nr:pur operon repressor [Hydrogenibacillus schlegelii]PTQ53056.1 MAG: PurR: transcription regulator associated with purine metabolism [Hydrogenibacillus schlegelii]
MAKKPKRAGRLVDLAARLVAAPYGHFSLTAFAEAYGAAKSSISEDLALIKDVLEASGRGTLRTFPGAAGGVRYEPWLPRPEAEAFGEALRAEMERPERLLAGGFVYITDLLGRPDVLSRFGRLVATAYGGEEIDWILTVETKGIPLATAVGFWLNRPVAVARKASQITEGSVVTVSYVSGTTRRIQTMSLSRRAIPSGARVLIVDDFLRGGGTIRGLWSLLDEFQATAAASVVLVETPPGAPRLVDGVRAAVRLTRLDAEAGVLVAEPGDLMHDYRAALLKIEGELKKEDAALVDPEGRPDDGAADGKRRERRDAVD